MATEHPARKLPGVDRILQDAQATKLINTYGRTALTAVVRIVLKNWRDNISDQNRDPPTHSVLLKQAADYLARRNYGLRRLINLTGTVIHTNLGRAALPDAAIKAMLTVAANPTDLEFDLSTGQRGDRDSHICPYGKTEMVRSSDEGKTWSDPVVIRNTPLDDRDAGLVETPDGTLISSWFTSVEFGDNPVHKAHAKTLSQQVRDRWKGHWTQRSTNSGFIGTTAAVPASARRPICAPRILHL